MEGRTHTFNDQIIVFLPYITRLEFGCTSHNLYTKNESKSVILCSRRRTIIIYYYSDIVTIALASA